MPRKVIERTGESSGFVSAVVAGYNNPIRNEADAKFELIRTLPFLARQYGTRKDIALEVMEEAAEMILTRFRNIGVLEIREAYRMKSAGQLQAPGAEMWGGEFSVDQIGKVLTAYCERRKAVLAEYLKEQERMNDEAEARRKQEEFNRNFPRMISEARDSINDWRDVPEFWYESARMRGMILFADGEADQIFKEARTLAKMDFENEYEEAPALKKIKLQAAALGHGDDLEYRARIYARKITVFRKLINIKK